MAILHGLVLEQVAFHTQILYNLCCYVAKILLHSYLEQPRPTTVHCVDNFEDYQKINSLLSQGQCWIHPHWYPASLEPLEDFEEER
jgi:hypothetical protein